MAAALKWMLTCVLLAAAGCSLLLQPSEPEGGVADGDSDADGDTDIDGDSDTDADSDDDLVSPDASDDADVDEEVSVDADAEPDLDIDAEVDADEDASTSSCVPVIATISADTIVSPGDPDFTWLGMEVLNTSNTSDLLLYSLFQFSVTLDEGAWIEGGELCLTRAVSNERDCWGDCPHRPGDLRLHVLRQHFVERQVSYNERRSGREWSIGPGGEDRGALLATESFAEDTERICFHFSGMEFTLASAWLPFLVEASEGTQFVAYSREGSERDLARLTIRICTGSP